MKDHVDRRLLLDELKWWWHPACVDGVLTRVTKDDFVPDQPPAVVRPSAVLMLHPHDVKRVGRQYIRDFGLGVHVETPVHQAHVGQTPQGLVNPRQRVFLGDVEAVVPDSLLANLISGHESCLQSSRIPCSVRQAIDPRRDRTTASLTKWMSASGVTSPAMVKSRARMRTHGFGTSFHSLARRMGVPRTKSRCHSPVSFTRTSQSSDVPLGNLSYQYRYPWVTRPSR